MNWHSTAGKSALIKMLMKEHGFSKRKAEKAVNTVFYCMARALRRGDEVELPIGWIQTARPPARESSANFRGSGIFRLERYRLVSSATPTRSFASGRIPG